MRVNNLPKPPQTKEFTWGLLLPLPAHPPQRQHLAYLMQTPSPPPADHLLLYRAAAAATADNETNKCQLVPKLNSELCLCAC